MSTDPRPADEREPSTPAANALGFILNLAVIVGFIAAVWVLAVVLT